MNYHPKPDSHIRDKFKELLDLSNYATKKELKDPIHLDTSDLAAKKDLISLKAEVKKLDIIKLVNGVSGLNNF